MGWSFWRYLLTIALMSAHGLSCLLLALLAYRWDQVCGGVECVGVLVFGVSSALHAAGGGLGLVWCCKRVSMGSARQTTWFVWAVLSLLALTYATSVLVDAFTSHGYRIPWW